MKWLNDLFKKWNYDSDFLRRKNGIYQNQMKFSFLWDQIDEKEYYILLAEFIVNENRKKDRIDRLYKKALKIVNKNLKNNKNKIKDNVR